MYTLVCDFQHVDSNKDFETTKIKYTYTEYTISREWIGWLSEFGTYRKKVRQVTSTSKFTLKLLVEKTKKSYNIKIRNSCKSENSVKIFYTKLLMPYSTLNSKPFPQLLQENNQKEKKRKQESGKGKTWKKRSVGKENIEIINS